jgi:hypothetical protein
MHRRERNRTSVFMLQGKLLRMSPSPNVDQTGPKTVSAVSVPRSNTHIARMTNTLISSSMSQLSPDHFVEAGKNMWFASRIMARSCE